MAAMATTIRQAMTTAAMGMTIREATITVAITGTGGADTTNGISQAERGWHDAIPSLLFGLLHPGDVDGLAVFDAEEDGSQDHGAGGQAERNGIHVVVPPKGGDDDRRVEASATA